MMQQFQAVLRFDTRNPPGNEHIVAEYLKGVFDKAGIPAQIFALDANRSNVVARLKGNGKKKPILIMGHSDVVTVDEAKWKFPPFSATRDGGWVYARGTVDDKDNLTGGLMTMLLLKRYNVPLDRDVIFLSEAGEEGASNFGIGSWSTSTTRRSSRSTALPKAAARSASAASPSTRPSRRWRRSRAASSWLRTASRATDRFR